MNETEMKEMVGAICPDLDLSRCYPQIMPRVTVDQLGKLLDVAERGHNAPVWSGLVAQFLLYGQQDVVAAGMGRLVPLITDSEDAAWVLRKAPDLSDEHRDALVTLVTDSRDAAWVLRNAPKLSDDHRKRLVPLVTDSRDAAWLLLREAPHLSDENRDALVMAVTGSGDAAWVLREAPNLTAAHRAHLEKIAG